MIAKATLKHLRISPQKVRLVVDQIRGKGVEDAMNALRISRKGAARDVEKLLKSAVANAEQREERVDVDDLVVARAAVNTGPTQKRVRFRAMGRVFRILKRSSHVTLELDMTPRSKRRAAVATAPRTSKPARRTGRPGAAAGEASGVKRAAGATVKKKVTKKVKKTTKKKTTKKTPAK